MIEVISASGKKIMNISDTNSAEDTLFIDGKPVSLSDAYSNDDLKFKFNDQIKELGNVKQSKSTE